MSIDLRSDTVTRPDQAMRKAMAEAEVGDDVYGEDPTVLRLQEMAAAAAGTEAALFVPSGTMGNQIALRLLAAPGTEVIADADCHIFHYEMSAMAAITGLMPRGVPSDDGLPSPESVERAVQPEQSYLARTGALTLENTHNMAGGRVFDHSRIDPLLEVARRLDLPVHLDGARIFNAAEALGVSVADLTAGFDTVMFCLSKGLGAPVGSMLCSTRELIVEARRVRKMLGGGMRQAGVIAAAGLVALRDGPARLAEDHNHARLLAEGLAQLPRVTLDPNEVRTNIVIFDVAPEDYGDLAPAMRLARSLSEHDVLAGAIGPETMRFVTHRDVDEAACRKALGAVAESLGH